MSSSGARSKTAITRTLEIPARCNGEVEEQEGPEGAEQEERTRGFIGQMPGVGADSGAPCR
jgi:hypothetical protein